MSKEEREKVRCKRCELVQWSDREDCRRCGTALPQPLVKIVERVVEKVVIRVNVIPQKLKDGENAALTTPLTVTGTAEELDRELPTTIVGFVSAHLQLRNTLDKAKAEMDAAAKTAQAEARSKAKVPANRESPKTGAGAVETPEPTQPEKTEPVKTASLFDVPSSAPSATTTDTDEEEEILRAVEDEADEGMEEAA